MGDLANSHLVVLGFRLNPWQWELQVHDSYVAAVKSVKFLPPSCKPCKGRGRRQCLSGSWRGRWHWFLKEHKIPRIQTHRIFTFQSRTKQKIATSAVRHDTEEEFCLSCSSQSLPPVLLTPKYSLALASPRCLVAVQSFILGCCCSLMWLYTKFYMWQKSDEIPTTACTGFHLI